MILDDHTHFWFTFFTRLCSYSIEKLHSQEGSSACVLRIKSFVNASCSKCILNQRVLNIKKELHGILKNILRDIENCMLHKYYEVQQEHAQEYIKRGRKRV